jgi:hypothetical protein
MSLTLIISAPMKKTEKVVHQFGLFGYQPPRLRMNKKEKQALVKLLRESKALFEAGKYPGSVLKLRHFREGLEDFSNRITNGA